jgi:hypothetical protein
MSTDPFQPAPTDPIQPAPTDPAGRPAAPAGSPFAQPAVPTPGAFAPPVPGLEPVRPAAPRARRGGGSGLLVNALLGLALVVAIGGVAFAVGRATAPTAAAAGRTGTNGQAGQGGGFFRPGASGAPTRGGFGGGGGGFGGAVSVQGTVEAIDGSSITIKTAAGATVTLALNGDTSYHKQAPATAADVTTGSTVIVQVQGRGFGGPGGPAASGAPSASGAPAAGFGSAGSVTVVP